jgi:hypothetical protein
MATLKLSLFKGDEPFTAEGVLFASANRLPLGKRCPSGQLNGLLGLFALLGVCDIKY